LEPKKLLRAVSPKLYTLITAELEKQFNVQPYDIQAEGRQKENGIVAVIRYGEQFTQKKEQFFPFDSIQKDNKVLLQFVEETGKACQEIMIKDYYRMMAP
jgi:hypothetical protein